MSKIEMFLTSIALLFIVCFLALLCFVSYIYYDAAMTIRAYAQELSLQNNQMRRQISLNIDHEISRSYEDQDWQELSFEEVT